MGTKGVIDYELTWLAGLHTTGEQLPSTHLAVIRLYWRHVYAAMPRLKFDKDPFSINAVQTGISHTLYSRLLAYQHSLAIRFYRRRRARDDESRRLICAPATRHRMLRSEL
eukprot:2252380-Pleurochrysis_carterae.AAC.2